jgi:hypothetical protein
MSYHAIALTGLAAAAAAVQGQPIADALERPALPEESKMRGQGEINRVDGINYQ